MQFANPPPWWLALLLATAVGLLSLVEYRRPSPPLTRVRRATLTALRALSLGALVLLVLRPTISAPSAGAPTPVVAVLVDVSESMRLADERGGSRLSRAVAVLTTELLPAVRPQFTPEVYAVGERVARSTVESLTASARRSDLSGALRAIRERYRGRNLAGIVLLSDGGDTAPDGAPAAPPPDGPPVFTVGVGSPDGPRDRELGGLTADEQHLDEATIDLRVTAISSGFGRAPFQLRLLANERLVESREITPSGDHAPVEQLFTVAPDPVLPTIYTAQISPSDDEMVTENNARSVLVSPPGRHRRLLVIEGAPGFEHSFMTRAWARDPGLEVDSIVRKGINAEGQNTFLVQAAARRAEALTGGFPARREDLFAYDGLVLANTGREMFSHEQLVLAAEFVSERGGGLLVLGSRSFANGGLKGTPLESALPVELAERPGGLAALSLVPGQRPGHNKISVTVEGDTHPVMRIGASPEENRRLWAAMPQLAASAPLGAARSGASVLAVTSAPAGALVPVIAVQRYGQGRSLVFGGEGSWRWRMMLPSADRSYEMFWRQAARWLTATAADPVVVTAPGSSQPGDTIAIAVDARDAGFAPVADATVEATLIGPDGSSRALAMRRAVATAGRFTAAEVAGAPGVYRIHIEAKDGPRSLGSADRWIYVGGASREFADPRLNDGYLRRLARATGGQYAAAADVARIGPALQSLRRADSVAGRRDLWDRPWVFALIVALLSAEWLLRRRWGLR